MDARSAFTLILVLMFWASMVFGQKPFASPPPEKSAPAKVNERPTPVSTAITEPFDKADIKTMAEKCVRFVTDFGDIEAEMYPESAPDSVRNFLNLVSTGAFDTTTFSRVVPGFVVQGGNIWTREGRVSSDLDKRARRTVKDEPNKIPHERGTLSMARGDEANSATTNFFILVASASYLDGKFAAFGKVTKGMDVVDAINKAEVESEKPVKPVRIKKAVVEACSSRSVP